MRLLAPLRRSLGLLSCLLLLVGSSGCASSGGAWFGRSRPAAAAVPPTAAAVAPPDVAAGAEAPAARRTAQKAIVPPFEPVEYRIGADDELEISVYGDEELSKTQVVRTDGKIALPFVGEIQAEGRTPDDLRRELSARLTRVVADPAVTVIVKQYGSRKVSVVGEVHEPGVLVLDSEPRLLHAIAEAGGMTERADLRGAMVVRNGVILPVSLHKLLREGDFSHNIVLEPRDAIVVPDSDARRAMVLGQVNSPTVVPLKEQISLMEAIVYAKGFKREAATSRVVIVRGGLAAPELIPIDMKDILEFGVATKPVLEAGDIVYVPKSTWSSIVEVFDDLRKILSPILLMETGIALYPQVQDALTGKGSDINVSIPVAP